MKQEEDLSRADIYARDYYLYTPAYNTDQHLYDIGKEIHEALQPKPWKPNVLNKGYIFDVDRISFVHGDVEELGELYLTRQAPTKELAERRLKNGQIQDTINAWILENRDENERHTYQIYITPQGAWNCKRDLGAINSEYCGSESVTELCRLLNAGLIHGVPKKMEV